MIKLFQTVKEIRSKSGELHFRRFAIFEIKNFMALYIHTIYQRDKDEFLHTHPWLFCGIIFKGSYLEGLETEPWERIKSPGSISIGGRHFCHKIKEVIKGPVKSLFFTFGKHKTWYYSLGKITNEQYRGAMKIVSSTKFTHE